MTFFPQDWSNSFLRDGKSWLVSMVFHGSMLVFQGFSPECTRPKLYPGPTIQSRSAARRAAWDLVVKMIVIMMIRMQEFEHVILESALENVVNKFRRHITIKVKKDRISFYNL